MYVSVTASPAEETLLQIFKQRVGLTKRSSFDSDALTLSNVSVNQTDTFTVHETSDFVTLIIPTVQILQTKVRAGTMSCLQNQRWIITVHTVWSSFCWKVSAMYIVQEDLISVKHLNQVCFTDLRRQQTPLAAVLQGWCCAHLQRDKSQNALDHGEHTAMHKWVCCWWTQ